VEPPGAFEVVPPTLPVVGQLGRVEAARPWLAELPSLVAQVREAFGVRLSPPLHGGSCSWVAPAELPDGTPVIVKIGWPHREMYGEPAALRAWNGRGAVRLLAHDPRRHALLLERCEPGRQLVSSPGGAAERLRAGCGVLRLLWDPARVLRARVALLAGELSLDADRIVWWSVARRVELALWAAHHGDVAGGLAAMRKARVLADL
jgi:hypothetical protein